MDDQEQTEFLKELKEHAVAAMNHIAEQTLQQSPQLKETGQHLSLLSARVILLSNMMSMCESLYPAVPYALSDMLQHMRDMSYSITDTTRSIQELLKKEQQDVEPEQSSF